MFPRPAIEITLARFQERQALAKEARDLREQLETRKMVERAKDHPTVLVDGVKILYPDGWALVLPDPEVALTHVWADAASDAEARRLVAIHAGQVAELSA